MKSPSLMLFFALLVALVGPACSSGTVVPLQPPAVEPVLPSATAAPAQITPTPTPASAEETQRFFDDFSYAAHEDMAANGWVIRTGGGWPGVAGATFRAENVSLLDDAEQAGNRLVRMTSSTDGTSANTFQTQICHQRKYLEGTYAARVRFSDAPVSGPDGDQIVETFYAITPYKEPFDPLYSEMDYEYLPNGGWGSQELTFFVTTWETVQIEPWNADNTSSTIQGSQASWHTLVTQVGDQHVRYLLDGKLIGEHIGKYYPDALMSINFNLWFIDGGLIQERGLRVYEEDIDWVFYQAGEILTVKEVHAQVKELRNAAVTFQDTVLPGIPTSPCDL